MTDYVDIALHTYQIYIYNNYTYKLLYNVPDTCQTIAVYLKV